MSGRMLTFTSCPRHQNRIDMKSESGVLNFKSKFQYQGQRLGEKTEKFTRER
jgi:hypothetical protein